MKPRVRKYRLRPGEPLPVGGAGAEAAPGAGQPAAQPATGGDGGVPAPAREAIEAIRAEGLTGRQLRMARRIAQRHGMIVTSDFDAVRQLRAKGIDPFQRSNVLELVVPGDEEQTDETEGAATVPDGKNAGHLAAPPLPRAKKVQLPSTIIRPAEKQLPSTERTTPGRESGSRLAEIRQIQREIARRRRRNIIMLSARIAVLVMLPTLMAWIYYSRIATPMYATHAEFQINKAEATGIAAGASSLLTGTAMATQQDSTTVQGYLTSRAAMLRLNEDHAFKAVFSDEAIDPIQRLAPDATNEEAYRLYKTRVKIGYDPSEGIIRLEVIAPSPEISQEFADALIRYAEEQVDQLTLRLREDAMSGARAAYEEAEARRQTALQTWLSVQQQVAVIDPISATAALTSQISSLEAQRQRKLIELNTRLAAARPNAAQVEAIRTEIANYEALIAELRAQMTSADADGGSLAAKNTELRTAEENYTFQTLMVQSAQQAMESSRLEAERQVRYLSVSVPPVAPDEPTYPRAFENTLLAFLIFAGAYLMISLTASVLREQVSA